MSEFTQMSAHHMRFLKGQGQFGFACELPIIYYHRKTRRPHYESLVPQHQLNLLLTKGILHFFWNRLARGSIRHETNHLGLLQKKISARTRSRTRVEIAGGTSPFIQVTRTQMPDGRTGCTGEDAVRDLKF